jgi:hypothetical protein
MILGQPNKSYNVSSIKIMTRVLIIWILIFASFEGVACICFFSKEKKWQKERINSADVIFIGTARLDVSVKSVTFWGADSLVEIENLVFEVDEGFKVPNGKKEIKLSSRGCGGSYKIGKQYLIFGYVEGHQKLLRTDNCGSYTENENHGASNIGSKQYRRLKELIIREKKRLKF